MKKILLAFLLACGVFIGFTGAKIATNNDFIVVHAFEEETYTYTEEEKVVTLVLISETECTLTFGGETINLTYERTDNNITINNGDEKIKVTVNPETHTFGPYVYPAYVTVNKVDHGKVELSAVEGEVGDIIVLDISHDILYKIANVQVNGVNLIEDENISRRYSFALAEGENVISVSIVVDETILGGLSDIYAQMGKEDWTWDKLFTVDNIIALVRWVLDGGILLAIIAYYIRDKRLSKTVKEEVRSSMQKIVPQMTKDTVIANFESVLTPIFTQLKADNVELMRAMGVFAQCMALAQEDTPEARTAIIELLSGLNISDEKTMAQVKAYIEKLVSDNLAKYQEVINEINKIKENNKEIVGDNQEEKPVENNEVVDDGTEI